MSGKTDDDVLPIFSFFDIPKILQRLDIRKCLL